MPQAAAPTAVRFEHRTDGGPVLGVGTGTPRLSWYVPEAEPGYAQDAYEVEISRDGGEQETITVESDEQVLVPWPGTPLGSREAATVRVRVRGGQQWSGWSEPATVEAGLLHAGDWSARFVSPREIGGIGEPAPVVGTTFAVEGEVARARLYATAHGVHVTEINGRRVGDDALSPGWTSYAHRLRYHTYDVTDLVHTGENGIGALLGNGWYRGRLGFRDARALYGNRLALLAQLEITTTDGKVLVIGTDENWTARESQVTADDLYDGQATDLRRAPTHKSPVDLVDGELSRLVAPEGPPVRVTEVLPAVKVWQSPSGRTLVDFGQNVVGRVRLTIHNGKSGDEVTVRHAEVLEDGELGVRPLRTAKATDTYILTDGDHTLESELTFHGFRYAEVTGAPEMTAEAVVLGSDLSRTGWFESSHELLNRFHENVVWGMRGNFLDVPTDCPQRDERLGWTGDIQVFSPTASFLFDCAGFLSSWLADLAADQHKDGSVPFVIPDVLNDPGPTAAAWGDAATLVPWVVYQRSGDADVLRRQLPSMRAWVDRIAELSGPGLLRAGGFQFGDWLDPAAPPENPFEARTDPDVIATAHFARSAEVTGRAAAVVGDDAAAQRYLELAARVREAFAREYTTAGGRVLSDAATGYALALEWSLLPSQQQRAHAGRRLADLVRSSGFRISTGFVGTPLIADALTSAGEHEVAYRLLLQTGVPSWLYPVTMGATTVWERWDSMLPDGRINPGEMTSFNHYALGAVADWLHRCVAGLAPAAPGYRELLVKPVPGPGLTRAHARHITPYGPAAAGWERSGGSLTVTATIPVGATATVVLPNGDEHRVKHGTHEWTVDEPAARPNRLHTVRDVLDHEPTWAAVRAAAAESDITADEPAAAGRLARYLDEPATQLAQALAPRGFVPGAEAFAERVEALLNR